MPTKHIQHLADMSTNTESAKNYGLAFAYLNTAIKKLMDEEERWKENDENISRVGVYAKSKHPTEHLHIKLYPWMGTIGQPYTVDSSYEKKEVHHDKKTSTDYVTMLPVHKTRLTKERHSHLTKRFIKELE